MSNDFVGFNFLPASAHPVSDIRRGYAVGPAATSDVNTTGTPSVGGATITGDTTTHHGINLDTSLLSTAF